MPSPLVGGRGVLSATAVCEEATPHPALRATFSHKGKEDQAASIRRNPFHTAVAAPDVSTGRIRAS